MSFRTTLIALALTAVCSLTANAQTDFFWSFNNLNTGATNADISGVAFNAGESGTAYLYYSAANSDIDTGAGIDVSWVGNNNLRFTGARTFDFAISIGGVPIDNRWVDNNGDGGFFGDAQEVQDTSITGLNAFTFTGGQGILNVNGAAGPFADEGYDAGADAFLFASVDFVAVGGRPFGEFVTTVGDIGVVSNGQSLNPTFGGLSIGVPEPTSASLIALGLLGFSVVRRRQ